MSKTKPKVRRQMLILFVNVNEEVSHALMNF